MADTDTAAELPNEKFITLAETARLFRVTPRTLERWAVAGHFHPVRFGRFSLIPRFEVLAALNSGGAAPWIYSFDESGELIATTTDGKQVKGF